MMGQRLAFGAVGLFVWALVAWAIRAGHYPSHGQEISRAGNLGAFWTIMVFGGLFGGAFVLFAITI